MSEIQADRTVLCLLSKMQVLIILVALLLVNAADAEDAEERAVVQGFHCDYVMYVLSLYAMP